MAIIHIYILRSIFGDFRISFEYYLIYINLHDEIEEKETIRIFYFLSVIIWQMYQFPIQIFFLKWNLSEICSHLTSYIELYSVCVECCSDPWRPGVRLNV